MTCSGNCKDCASSCGTNHGINIIGSEGKLYDMSKDRQFQDSFPRMYPELAENIDTMVVKNITFVTTESCNLACTYCYECRKTPRHMSTEVAKKAIDAIFDKEKMNDYVTDDNKCVIIEFIGGEPFLNMEVMEFICEYFLYKANELNHPWAKYHMFNVTTNGTLVLKDERVHRWIEKYRERLSISITIDGDKALHDACRVYHDGRGSYDDVSEAVKFAIKEFGLNNTKVTFAHANIDKINTAIPHLMDEIGLTGINANCVYEDVWEEGDDKIFFNELVKLADWMISNKKYETGYVSIFDENIGHPMPEEENRNWCGGDGQMLAISVDGKFFPCIRYMKYALSHEDREEMIIGTVEDGIESKEDNKYLQMLSGITRRSQSCDECWNCPVAQGCSWCTAYNYDEFGTPDKRATYICKMHKARVAANVYYWNRVYTILKMDKVFELDLPKEDCLKFMTDGQYSALQRLILRNKVYQDYRKIEQSGKLDEEYDELFKMNALVSKETIQNETLVDLICNAVYMTYKLTDVYNYGREILKPNIAGDTTPNVGVIKRIYNKVFGGR